MKHENNGACAKCMTIINRYSGFNLKLLQWFIDFQKKNPEFHTSCAGRGKDEQEAYFHRGASKARYGQSAHNYNAALDLFELDGDDHLYEKELFIGKLKPNLPSFIKWYGEPGSSFYELPHIELKDWVYLKNNGLLKLVE